MKAQLNILLLADDRHPAVTLLDHVRAFPEHSRHRWFIANPRYDEYVNELDLRVFDVVVIHYSLCVIFDTYIPSKLRTQISAFTGPKIQFIQDEYRWVNRISECIADLGIDVLFTLVHPENVERAYNHPRLRRVRKVSTLPGFIPDHLATYPARPIRERGLHVAYRSRRLPYWLGDLSQDKVRIADGVLHRAGRHGLRVDIDVEESARIYGNHWFEFVASAKAVLGTEGGASIWDYDSKAEEVVRGYLAEHPHASYEEVAPLLKPYEGNLMYNTMSPRLFEAAALRTAMVMFPGRYDDVVEPGRHYIALHKDFSNFDEVAAMLNDDEYLQQLVDWTYDDIVRPGRYSKRAFVRQVDEIIEQAIDARRTTALAAPLSRSDPQRAFAVAQRALAVARRRARLNAMLRVDLSLFRRSWNLLAADHYTAREKLFVVLNAGCSLIPGRVQNALSTVLRRVFPAATLDGIRTRRREVADKRARLIEAGGRD